MKLTGQPPKIDNQDLRFPVIEEELAISSDSIETGKVLLRKRIVSDHVVVDQPLLQEGYDVERVPKDVMLSEAAKTRYEGDTLVLPVMEEVLVVEKRLCLVEEIRITPRRSTVHQPQSFELRKEQIEVERQHPDAKA